MTNVFTIDTPCFYRISVKALVWDESHTKFMVVEEADGRFEFPGGGLDFGEDYRAGLTREIKEEMGLEITSISDAPTHFITFHRDNEKENIWMANLFYEVKLKNLDFTPSNECVSLRFVNAEEALALNAFSNVHQLAGEMLRKSA